MVGVLIGVHSIGLCVVDVLDAGARADLDAVIFSVLARRERCAQTERKLPQQHG